MAVEFWRQEKIKAVSFDIFDTVLLRAVSRPEDVFALMYDQIRYYLPEEIDREKWKNIRKKAERDAREQKEQKCGYREIVFNEIYENMPADVVYKEDIQKVELQIEKEVCYCNPIIQAVIEKIRKETTLSIVLTSDMYLPKICIDELLMSCGFPLEWIDRVFISCEAKRDKRSGNLFQYVLQELGMEPYELVHVGDNPVSDVLRPSQQGIRSFFYGAVSECLIKHPFLELEDMEFGKEMLEEIRSLRNIVSYGNNVYSGNSSSEEIIDQGSNNKKGNFEKDIFWFDLGAMILGPLYTAAIGANEEKNTIKELRDRRFVGKLSLLVQGKLPNEMVVAQNYMEAGKCLSILMDNEVFHKSEAGDVCLKGINAFRNCYLQVKEQKPFFCEITWQERFIMPVVRLFTCPLKEEADKLCFVFRE